MHLIPFIFLSLLCHKTISQTTPLTTSVIAITKDQPTSLHKVSWRNAAFKLLDLDAPFTWENCRINNPPGVACGLEEGCRFPVPCNATLCVESKSYINPICPSLDNFTFGGCNICAVTPFNPISKTCKISQLTTDLVDIYLTNGRNPSRGARYPFGYQYVLSCAPDSLLAGFPEGVRGAASFSWSRMSFPRQLSYLHSTEKFAVCLPRTSSANGVVFLGDGPFYFTQIPKVDLSSILSYTPMVRKNSGSLGYYIKINRILIGGTPINFPSLKTVSVKLSSVVSYTTLRSDIYKALVAGFSTATKAVPRANAVKPFTLCLKTGSGFSAPKIDLETESGKMWTIAGDNSLTTINGSACLAFIDGGSKVKDAIVIGTYQMENNFLFFDLGNQKLGFSSSLLGRGTSCSGFNFTLVGN